LAGTQQLRRPIVIKSEDTLTSSYQTMEKRGFKFQINVFINHNHDFSSQHNIIDAIVTIRLSVSKSN
jgi:hypothetical protein